MRTASLRVIHQLKESASDAAPEIPKSGEILSIDTCQRRLWVLSADTLSTLAQEPLENLEIHSGQDAYHFLLRVATGLESQVKGETEIFGQIRSSWQTHVDLNGEVARPLGWTIQRLFEDTKEIRTAYLQGFGGSSYGSLVRKLLRSRTPGPVLVVGAGQLARAILPYLQAFDVSLWNRSPARIPSLLMECGLEPGPNLRVVPQKGELDAWHGATHAVICTPADAARDLERIEAWKANPLRHPDGTVIHLGCAGPAPSPWTELTHVSTLQDLFRLQQQQGASRKVLVEQAEAACAEKAEARASAQGVETLALLG